MSTVFHRRPAAEMDDLGLRRAVSGMIFEGDGGAGA
jgi:hypothetical protein